MTTFAEARQFLFEHRDNYAKAYAGFRWPDPVPFNWALDWFDTMAADPAIGDRPALRIVDTASDNQTRATFAQMARKSNQVANWLRSLGVKRGDRVLLPLGNIMPLWEVMLASIKLGAVVIPATTLLPESDLADRVKRGNVKVVVTSADQVGKFKGKDGFLKIVIGETSEPGWHKYDAAAAASAIFKADRETKPDDPLLLYFTSGTTAKPKLVLHSHRSYPVGHLSTMFWIGIRQGDLHLNISSPGWAKHAWSSFFAPWNAGATIFIVNQPRFEAKSLLDAVERAGVTTLCAPPTVWRLLVQQDLAKWKTSIRELASAGEPLNPEVIERVRKAWGITIRDGYGQTETSCQIGNSPGQKVKEGSMGLPMPGYKPMLLTTDDEVTEEGEICLPTDATRPAGLMQGYDDGERGKPLRPLGPVYRTGDVAMRDHDGYLTFVGRSDDVFKASDYRISPFELESVLIEHPAIAEAGVIPAPDPIRLAVPKAFIALVPGKTPSRDLAFDVFRHLRKELAPFKRIRKIEFVKDLPKTISGKIRRVQLRAAEIGKDDSGWERGVEYAEDDFPELKKMGEREDAAS